MAIKYSWEIDLAVAINFFCRPDTLTRVFERVCEARPRRLFLIADGPRNNVESDAANCQKCRDIVESMINWDCEVFRYYNDENKGLFVTYFESMSKVFEIVDYCVFLEDDVVVDTSFFGYCKELLEKYLTDYRISFVTGINFMSGGISDNVKHDYFFSGEGSLTAYGLWKRTFNSMNMSFLNDQYTVSTVKKYAKKIKPGYDRRITKYQHNITWQGHLPHVEVYKNLLRFTQNQICIVPKRNMVVNIGVSADATHSADNIKKLPRATQVIFSSQSYCTNLPLSHPDYVVCDLNYEKRVNYLLAWNKPWLKWFRRIEAAVRHLIYGDYKRIFSKLKTIKNIDIE